MGKIDKYDKFSEALRTKSFKDMETWSAKGEIKVSKSKKKLNTDDGEKFIELFNKYNIHVDFGSGTIRSEKFGDEKELKEVRIGLYSYLSYDDWIENNGYTDAYLDKEKLLSEEEYEKEYETYKKELTKLNEDVSFSVFIGSNNDSKNINLCMADAYLYLKEKLKGIDEIFKYVIEDRSFQHIEEIKQYMININFTINRKNLEEIQSVATRLRQDSKVFIYLDEEHFRQSSDFSYQDFINDLKNL